MTFNKIPLALGFNSSTGNASGLVEFTLDLSNVGDVCEATPTEGQTLVYSSTGKWCPSTIVTGGGGIPTPTSPVNGDILAYNGTSWQASTASELNLPRVITHEIGNPLASIGTTSKAPVYAYALPAGTLDAGKTVRFTLKGTVLQNETAVDNNVCLYIDMISDTTVNVFESSGTFVQSSADDAYTMSVSFVGIANDVQFATQEFKTSNTTAAAAGTGGYSTVGKQGFAYAPLTLTESITHAFTFSQRFATVGSGTALLSLDSFLVEVI